MKVAVSTIRDKRPSKGALDRVLVYENHEFAKGVARRFSGTHTSARTFKRTIKADSLEIEVSVVVVRERT